MDPKISSRLDPFLAWLFQIPQSPVAGQIISWCTAPGPVQMTLVFLMSSMVMVWRLNAVEKKGVEGTMVGTLIMPYCSGFSNLAFAYVMGKTGGQSSQVLENCLVNNVTNLTVIIGIPALFWGMQLHKKSNGIDGKISYFSLLLTLITLLFFTAAVWVLGRDGVLDFSDGLMLCGLFLFWQVIHLFDVMKQNVRKKQPFRWSILLDFLFAGLAAWACLQSIDYLVDWVTVKGRGWLAVKYLGILSGILMVVPNALLAFYYCARSRTDIAYSSQLGDCHICIPLCIGVYALFTPIPIPAATFEPAMLVIMGAALFHLFFTALTGRIPRPMGLVLILGYAGFMIRGLGQI